MSQEPTQAPVPPLTGFAKNDDAGASFRERMMQRRSESGASASADPERQSQTAAPAQAAKVEPLRAPSPTPGNPPATPPTLKAPSSKTNPAGDGRHVKPTVLSVDASIVERFEDARKDAPSHTGLILQALQSHYQELPQLIVDRRPKAPAEGLFPFRPPPGEAEQERRLPIRIRPLAAELAVIDELVEQCKQVVDQDVTRSEMVGAALDAHLPKKAAKRRRPRR